MCELSNASSIIKSFCVSSLCFNCLTFISEILLQMCITDPSRRRRYEHIFLNHRANSYFPIYPKARQGPGKVQYYNSGSLSHPVLICP